MANRQLWKITSWKVSRFSRKAKLPSPTNCVIFLFSIAQVDRVERRIDHQAGDQQDQRQAHQEARWSSAGA